MLIKFRDRIFDSEKDPIVLSLSDKDKDNLKQLIEQNATRICLAPEQYPDEWIKGYPQDKRLDIGDRQI